MAKGKQGRVSIKDGRSRCRQIRECGVYIPARGSFCDLPCISIFRRCEFHTRALHQDGLSESLRHMKAAERKQALNMLDAVQKIRPPWTYAGDEESLIAAQETENTNG